ncbi:hypothetical protein cyc_05994 [Cyclospora cayetanensis]|uniref:Uncharacterized protein n=1 Tax=Cyclospora cayetanensis TaxID=88456 RepID=A0A1D3DB72_9EIME|nr:hypothetical protein cyc_05994 [Cyclospora cayetanensis]
MCLWWFFRCNSGALGCLSTSVASQPQAPSCAVPYALAAPSTSSPGEQRIASGIKGTRGRRASVFPRGVHCLYTACAVPCNASICEALAEQVVQRHASVFPLQRDDTAAELEVVQETSLEASISTGASWSRSCGLQDPDFCHTTGAAAGGGGEGAFHSGEGGSLSPAAHEDGSSGGGFPHHSASKPAAALHALLLPRAAAAALASGKSLSALFEGGGGEASAGGSSEKHTGWIYSEMPEGSFLAGANAANTAAGANAASGESPAAALRRAFGETRLSGEQTRMMQQCALDADALRRDLCRLPVSVLLYKAAAPSAAAAQQQRQAARQASACVVLPFSSVAPAAPAAAHPSCSASAGAPKSSFLLNVGGTVLALAVSEECGVSEALKHCRSNPSAASTPVASDAGGKTPMPKGSVDTEPAEIGSGGFVVLAVSVSPFQCSHHQARGDEADALSSSRERSNKTDMRCQRKGASSLAVVTNREASETGAVLLQQQHCLKRPGALQWVPNSRLLLPPCTAGNTRAAVSPEERCCKDGEVCCRSRLGLLVGILENGALAMWSVPLWPLLPEEEGWLPLQHAEEESAADKRREGTEKLYAAGEHRETPCCLCCVLPPVWTFSSPSARLFCCAAAPVLPAASDAGLPPSLCGGPPGGPPLTVVAGAEEGRLYIFSFISHSAAAGNAAREQGTLSASPHALSSMPGAGDFGEGGPPLRGALLGGPLLGGGLQVALSVVTPGCRASEMRCCSFLPVQGSSLLAVALRGSGSRSGSVLVLDIARCAVGASGGAAGVCVPQGLHAVADSAALQVVGSNFSCCRAREISDLVWCPWGRYLLAAAENALLISLQKQHVKQLPVGALLGSLSANLVQGHAAALESRGQGTLRSWQWSLAEGEEEATLCAAQRVDSLVALQQLEERCALLSRGLVIWEEAHAAGSGGIQHSAVRAKRNSKGAPKVASILALHRSVFSQTSVCLSVCRVDAMCAVLGVSVAHRKAAHLCSSRGQSLFQCTGSHAQGSTEELLYEGVFFA